MKAYKHINQNERELIFLYSNQGLSQRGIGKLLHRSYRSIGRELVRNKGDSEYSAIVAHTMAKDRRSQARIGSRKLDSLSLQSYVIKKLGKGWSPEIIAGRLKCFGSLETVCQETIYQFIYSKEYKRLRLHELLRRQHRKRHLFMGRKTNRRGIIPNRVFIDQRPEIINQRKQVGHWETDLMEGPKKTKSHVNVIVERTSRLVKLTKVATKQAREKTTGLIQQLSNIPRDFVKSVTYDNGKENTEHQVVARQLNCQTYFCNPYHSWEKGTVENTIGLVRQYLPKKMDLEPVTQGELNWIAWQLNNRPKKVLGYLTPSEKFYQETKWVT